MEERRNRMRTTMRTNDNIRMHEFIGLDAEVLQATCPTLVGKKGCVVDETRNTLRLRIAAGKDAGNAREIIVPKIMLFNILKGAIISGIKIFFCIFIAASIASCGSPLLSSASSITASCFVFNPESMNL